MTDSKLKALSNHLALDEEEAKDIENQADDLFSYGNQDWLVATDDEADAKAKSAPSLLIPTCIQFKSSLPTLT